MLDGIVHGLASNVVEMRRHGVIVDQHGSKTLEPAADREQVFHFAGQLLQG